MRIAVGSKNKPKLEAVREIVKEYDFFAGAEVVGISVVSGVREQPVGLDETVQGAINRAKSAFHNCQYAIGLESGIIPVPQTKSGYMDLTVCAIYDGATIHLGMSSAFEYPPQMVKMALEDGIDISTNARKNRRGRRNDRFFDQKQAHAQRLHHPGFAHRADSFGE